MKQIAIYGKGGVETSTIYHAMLQRLRILIAIVNTITNWITSYREGGIEALLTLHYKGGLKNEANKGAFAIAKDVKHSIKQHFNIEYNLSYVQFMIIANFTVRQSVSSTIWTNAIKN